MNAFDLQQAERYVEKTIYGASFATWKKNDTN
jgi:hypothetical protein